MCAQCNGQWNPGVTWHGEIKPVGDLVAGFGRDFHAEIWIVRRLQRILKAGHFSKCHSIIDGQDDEM